MKKVFLALSFAGVVFAGYLSSVKFFSKTCAFGESCPYFLGYPACYFGLGMFLALFIIALLWNREAIQKLNALMLTMIISLAGILFAGYFTLQELPILFEKGLSAYVLGLPTCALGLIFYITIFIVSWRTYQKN